MVQKTFLVSIARFHVETRNSTHKSALCTVVKAVYTRMQICFFSAVNLDILTWESLEIDSL